MTSRYRLVLWYKYIAGSDGALMITGDVPGAGTQLS